MQGKTNLRKEKTQIASNINNSYFSAKPKN